MAKDCIHIEVLLEQQGWQLDLIFLPVLHEFGFFEGATCGNILLQRNLTMIIVSDLVKWIKEFVRDTLCINAINKRIAVSFINLLKLRLDLII